MTNGFGSHLYNSLLFRRVKCYHLAMRYSVDIRNNATGETRMWNTDTEPLVFADADEMASFIRFLWDGGNYGCDCNRHLAFAAAGGEDEPDVECGQGRFSVTHALCDDGSIISIGD